MLLARDFLLLEKLLAGKDTDVEYSIYDKEFWKEQVKAPKEVPDYLEGFLQLTAEEQDLREAVWKVRLQMTTGQLQDPQRVRRARRDLARIMTIKRERQLEAQKGATGE